MVHIGTFIEVHEVYLGTAVSTQMCELKYDCYFIVLIYA